MSTEAKDAPPTMTPQQAWERRVREAMRWAEERLEDERSAGEHLHLCVLVTHVRMLGFVAERRAEERDALLEAAKAVAGNGRAASPLEWVEAHEALEEVIAKVEGECK